MMEALITLGSLILFVLLMAGRWAWAFAKLILVAGVIFGALRVFFSYAPATWPPFGFSFDGLFESIGIVIEMATRAWLPLGIAMAVLWTWGINKTVKHIENDVSQSKIAVVALMNYLDIAVETEGMKGIKENGWKFVLQEWKSNFWLKVILGRMHDDTLTANPVRMQTSKSPTLLRDIEQTMKKGNTP